jgi:SagB-type dehydrogenase family enzyme
VPAAIVGVAMRFDWATPTGPVLREQVEERLSELYHENSKLFPALAQEQAANFSVSAFDLYLMSRGFRQYRNAPRATLPEIQPSQENLQEVMLRRRSRRDLKGALSILELATLLGQSLGPTAVVKNAEFEVIQALRAWPSAGGLYPLDTYLIVSKVEDLSPGLYHYNSITSELELLCSRPVELILRDGFFWQDFALTSALVVLFVATFERTSAKYGERGYRLVLLDAGHAAQNVLLTAEQLRLGAVAVAGFCDDALARDLNIDGLTEAVIHTIMVGRSDG